MKESFEIVSLTIIHNTSFCIVKRKNSLFDGLFRNTCVENSNCMNYRGGYMCQCKIGFEGDGKVSCQDENECQTGRFTCQERSSFFYYS